jgi:hypothetical protein
VIGGEDGAQYNGLVDVHLMDNLVAGILDDYSVIPNLTQDAIGNSIQMSNDDEATVTPAISTFPSRGGTGSSNVLAKTGQAWTGASDQTWFTITSGGSGSGSCTVGYSVEPNAL